jgi:hypothetical protein
VIEDKDIAGVLLLDGVWHSVVDGSFRWFERDGVEWFAFVGDDSQRASVTRDVVGPVSGLLGLRSAVR